jgi:4-amino-4-deoxy-L-arabinose transferase-like glycosyltransferase
MPEPKNSAGFLILILGVNLILNLGLGFYSGGGHSDASDYITLAIQIVTQHDWGQLIMVTNGREVISLWLVLLTLFMLVFGTTNYVAIVLTGLLGTLGVFAFYRLMRLFWNERNALCLAAILALTPVYLVISQNALYDALFIVLLLTALRYYFVFFTTHTVRHLVVSGLIFSLLAFVHGSGYPYIFLVWIVFPLFDKSEHRWKHWMLFSLAAGTLPVIQMLIWKFFLYGSFYPYQELAHDWSVNHDALTIEPDGLKHILRFFLILILGYTPVLFLVFWIYLLDLPVKTKKRSLAGIAVLFVVITCLLAGGIHIDSLYLLIVLFILLYHFALKRDLSQENGLVFLFGLLSVFTFSIYIRWFPKPYFHQKHFIYPVLFLIPVYWFYAGKVIRNEYLIFGILIGAFCFQFLTDMYFHLPKNKDKSPQGFRVKYSSTFTYCMPYTDEGIQKEIATWYKNHTVKPDDYILTNRHERYVNAQLNLAQNHYLKITDSYSLNKGFQQPTLEKTLALIDRFQPVFIHWDKALNHSLYQTLNRDSNRQFLFSYGELASALKDRYTAVDSLDNAIVFFQRR